MEEVVIYYTLDYFWPLGFRSQFVSGDLNEKPFKDSVYIYISTTKI